MPKTDVTLKNKRRFKKQNSKTRTKKTMRKRKTGGFVANQGDVKRGLDRAYSENKRLKHKRLAENSNFIVKLPEEEEAEKAQLCKECSILKEKKENNIDEKKVMVIQRLYKRKCGNSDVLCKKPEPVQVVPEKKSSGFFCSIL